MRIVLSLLLLHAVATVHVCGAGLTVPPPSSYAPMPEAVTSFGAVVHGDWLYTYGGHRGERHEYCAEDASAAFHRMNLKDGSVWETLPGDVPSQSPGLWAWHGYIYRIGGMAARNARDEDQDLHSHASARRFSIESRRWEDLPDLPAARSSHEIMIVGDRLYVVGGWSLSGASGNATWHETAAVLNLSKPEAGWTSLPQPFTRRGLSVALVGSRIYCIGGMDEDEEMSGAVDILDTRTGEWSQGPELPQARMMGFGSASCGIGDHLYVSPFSGILWRLNEAGNGWDEAAKLQPARFFHRIVPGPEGRLLALGGAGGREKLSSIEIVNLDRDMAMQWPNLRGPARDGVSTDSDWQSEWPVDGPRIAWRKELGTGLSSFAVSAGRVFTMGNTNDTDTLWCLDVVTGDEVWRLDYACPTASHKMPIVPGGPAATPTVAGDRVFTLSREGQFHCLNAANGEVIWKTHLIEDHQGKRPVYGYANSALVAGGMVFLDVGGDQGSTVALDTETGEVRWRRGAGEAGYSSPRLVWFQDRPALALFKGEGLVLLDPANGEQLIRHDTTARDFCNTITPAVAGERLVVSNTGNDGTSCLNLKETTAPVAWQKNDFGMLFNSPVIWQGRLLGFNDANRIGNELRCVDLASGETVWAFDGAGKGVFIVAGGRMLILSKSGELVVLDPAGDKPSVLSRAQLFGGTSWADPVLVSGRIYCRNNDGSAVCLDVTLEPKVATHTANAGH